jgi:hypothetical protein
LRWLFSIALFFAIKGLHFPRLSGQLTAGTGS